MRQVYSRATVQSVRRVSPAHGHVPPLSWPIHAKLRRPQTDTAHGCTQRRAPVQDKCAALERGAFSNQGRFLVQRNAGILQIRIKWSLLMKRRNGLTALIATLVRT